MREERCGGGVAWEAEEAFCPRLDEGNAGCPAVAGSGGATGNPLTAEIEVEALLGCRGFLWDILLEGRWTGCARERLRILCKRHGAGAVAAAFDRE